MKNIYFRYLESWLSESPLVLATVIRTSGSTPQKSGSAALIGKRGILCGTVGGGVTEGRVVEAAIKASETGKSELQEFNLANDISEKREAICGGSVTVLIDVTAGSSSQIFEEMQASNMNNYPGVLLTFISEKLSDEISVKRLWVEKDSALMNEMPVALRNEVTRLLVHRDIYGFAEVKAGSGEDEWSSCFLQPVFPPEKLVIAGAGHIGRALAHLGSLLNFEVTVVDDRAEYANEENIPDADCIVVDDIGVAMEALAMGKNTYVVIVTRGHQDDALALRPCIKRDLIYTGMIGSLSKVEAMRTEFLLNKWATTEQWDRIHSPIGLPIRSQTVEEIAISIAAELVLFRNQKR